MVLAGPREKGRDEGGGVDVGGASIWFVWVRRSRTLQAEGIFLAIPITLIVLLIF